MKQKIKFLLATIMMLVGMTAQATTTVTWNDSDIFSIGTSFTKDGVTMNVTSDLCDFDEKNFICGTFTSTVGNFTKIEVTAGDFGTMGSGWTIGRAENDDHRKATWTGTASSTVSFGGSGIMDGIWGQGQGVTIVFTIEPPTVDVTGITLSQTEAAMTVGGDALTLTATVAPDNAADKTVTWTTSDASVATVADGVVTAVGAGIATITATATNGTADTSDDKTATCTVTVTEPAAAIFAIDTDGTTQDFGSVELDATAQKTFTITNSGNKSLYVTISNPEDFTAEMTQNANVYFTDALGWGDIHVYYWNNGPEWPGAAMTELYTNEYGQKVYCYELPDDVEGIIFNGNGNQTVDITDEPIGKAYYTTDEKNGNNYTVGTWSYDNCVPAGMSRVLTVTMNTATLGSKSGNITLSFDAKNATSFTIPCTGETVAPATKYDLTLADGSDDHGTVTFTVGGVAADKAKKDDVVTVSVTPNEGYSAKDVTVRGYTSWEAASDVLTGGGDNPGLVSDITVTKNEENGIWTFTMPEANVWVTVSYAADKTALNDAITDAETYYNSIKDDHADAAAALQTAINAAKGVKDNTDATKEDVDDAIAALATAKTTAEGAVLTETKNELNDDITEAEAYYNSISESNPDAAAALLEAINAAKAVKDNADATQSEIETAAQTLTDALNAAKADVALKRITLTIPAKSYMARIDADKRQIEVAVDGVSLYTVKNVTNTEVVLTDELSVIAAEMPYFIYNDNDTEVEVSIVVSSEDADNVDYDSEHFKGTLVDKTFTDEDMEEADHYVLSGGSSFVWVKDAGVLSAGKCWIQLEKSPANARALSIVFEGETTGISTVKTAADNMDTAVYDLQGRRVMQPTKGLFIVNGKKVVIK